jgi:hypothetical protein
MTARRMRGMWVVCIRRSCQREASVGVGATLAEAMVDAKMLDDARMLLAFKEEK